MKTARARRTPAAQALVRAMKSAKECDQVNWHFVVGFLSNEHPSLSKEIEDFERVRIDALRAAESAT